MKDINGQEISREMYIGQPKANVEKLTKTCEDCGTLSCSAFQEPKMRWVPSGEKRCSGWRPKQSVKYKCASCLKVDCRFTEEERNKAEVVGCEKSWMPKPTPDAPLPLCDKCGGIGWYATTESGHHPQCDGTCQDGLCPIPVLGQIQCEQCRGTGKIKNISKAQDILDDDSLPEDNGNERYYPQIEVGRVLAILEDDELVNRVYDCWAESQDIRGAIRAFRSVIIEKIQEKK